MLLTATDVGKRKLDFRPVEQKPLNQLDLSDNIQTSRSHTFTHKFVSILLSMKRRFGKIRMSVGRCECDLLRDIALNACISRDRVMN